MKSSLVLIALSLLANNATAGEIVSKTLTCTFTDDINGTKAIQTRSQKTSAYEGAWSAELRFTSNDGRMKIDASAFQASTNPMIPIPHEVVLIKLIDAKKGVELISSNEDKQKDSDGAYLGYAVDSDANSSLIARESNVTCTLL